MLDSKSLSSVAKPSRKPGLECPVSLDLEIESLASAAFASRELMKLAKAVGV